MAPSTTTTTVVSSLKDYMPKALKDEMKKYEIDEVEFSKIHGLIYTSTHDAAQAAAAALIVLLRDQHQSLSMVLDIMTQSFQDDDSHDWSIPQALAVIRGCHRLANAVPPTFFSEQISQMEHVLQQAVEAYTTFLKQHFLPAKVLAYAQLMKTWKLALLLLRHTPSQESVNDHTTLAFAAAVAYLKEHVLASEEEDKEATPPDTPAVDPTMLVPATPAIDPTMLVTINEILGPKGVDNIEFVYADQNGKFPYLQQPLDWSSLAIDEHIFYTETVPEQVSKRQKQAHESSSSSDAVFPMIYSDYMELNEWAVRHSYVETVKYKPKGLFAIILNSTLPYLAGGTSPVTIKPDGSIESSTEDATTTTVDPQIVKMIISVLYELMESQHIQTEPLIRAYLAAAAVVVLYAVSETQTIMQARPYWANLQFFKIMDVTQCSSLQFVMLPALKILPRKLRKEIEAAKRNILDSFLWLASGELYPLVKEEKGFWPPPVLREKKENNKDLRYDVFCQLLSMVQDRLERVLKLLKLEKAQVPVLETFKFVLTHHVDLLWDRHVDHILLSCIYGVCRSCSHTIKFAEIIDGYIRFRTKELGQATCQRIARHIRLQEGDETGNVIAFYNQVFVPEMKNYLLMESNFADYVGKI